MSAPLHTPGPWEARGAMQHGKVLFWDIEPKRTAKYRGSVATVHQAEHIEGITADERDANAHLIAAAPDLLEALKLTLALARIKFGNLDENANKAFAIAENAIAKAEPVALQSLQPKKETV